MNDVITWLNDHVSRLNFASVEFLRSAGIIEKGWDGFGASLLVMFVGTTLLAAVFCLVIMLISCLLPTQVLRHKIRNLGFIILVCGLGIDITKFALHNLYYGSLNSIQSQREALKPKTDAIDAKVRGYLSINSLTIRSQEVSSEDTYWPPLLIWDVTVAKAGKYSVYPSSHSASFDPSSKSYVTDGDRQLKEGRYRFETRPDSLGYDPCTAKMLISVSYHSTYRQMYGDDYPDHPSEGTGIDAERSFTVIDLTQVPAIDERNATQTGFGHRDYDCPKAHPTPVSPTPNAALHSKP